MADMRIILLGVPGAGKGTQAQFISQKIAIPQISTGDILRSVIKTQSEFGNQVKSTLTSGNLVSDDIIITLVKKRISQSDCQNGFLLDGFPRTIPQAEALNQEKIYIDHVIEIYVDDEEVISRLSGRRIHPNSGRVYHIQNNPPKIKNKDDITGEPLIKREDDAEKTVYDRIKIYHKQTKPLIAFYQSINEKYIPKYHRIDGNGSVEEIKQRINEALFQI